jgi:hypothetical protein
VIKINKWIKYFGVGALVLSIASCKPAEQARIDTAAKAKEEIEIFSGKPVSISSIYDENMGYFSIAWDINGKEDIISCKVNYKKTLTKATAVVERIIRENELKNMPDIIGIKGHYDENRFVCDKLSARSYELDLHSGN